MHMKNHHTNEDFFVNIFHSKWFVTSHHCCPVTFCTNYACSFTSQVIYGWQPLKVLLTHHLTYPCLGCIPEFVSNVTFPNFNHWEMYCAQYSIPLPPTHTCMCARACVFKVLSHQTSMFLMAPAVKLKKENNYGNKMEMLGLEYETWNNVCVK